MSWEGGLGPAMQRRDTMRYDRAKMRGDQKIIQA